MTKKVDLEKYRSISVSATATPSRTVGRTVTQTDTMEKNWSKDIPAYKRLRAEGLQPPRVDGSAKVEATAESAAQVEGRKVIPA